MPTWRWWYIVVAAVVVIVGDPGELYAWGPATHVKLAGDLLANLSLLPAGVALLLARNARSFIYGTLATDVVFAKRWSRVKQCCHHWSTAFRLLERSQDDESRSFAYGYLAHLAADTVAHGKFVPHQIIAERTTVNFGHLYWEARADAAAGEPAWAQLDALLLADHDHHHDALAAVLGGTLLPHEINVALFERINRAVSHRGWRRSMQQWGRWSGRQLSAELLARYHAECLDRAVCVLTRAERSPVLREDPSGTAALAYAADMRKGWRRRRRLGLPLRHRATEAAAGHAPDRQCPEELFGGDLVRW